MSESEQKYVNEIRKHLKRWELMAGFLRTSHLLLGLISVSGSILVASKINSIDPIYIEWIAFSVALSVGLQTGFDLGGKANRVRRAWRHVNWSYIKYKSKSHEFDKLIDDYRIGEKIVGDVKEIVK